MEKNLNVNQVSNSFYESKAKHKFLFITITIIALLLSLYGKLLTIGWLTIMLTWIPILPIHFILFTIAGIKLANLKVKKQNDYISFFILCITILLYSYTFVDAGDVSSNRIIYFIDENVSYYISLICFLINIILAIRLIIKCSKEART